MNEITGDELIQLLTQLAARDLEAGASIYDHPCSVAIREIQSLDAEAKKWATAYRQAKESAQEIQSQLTAANARVEALEGLAYSVLDAVAVADGRSIECYGRRYQMPGSIRDALEALAATRGE